MDCISDPKDADSNESDNALHQIIYGASIPSVYSTDADTPAEIDLITLDMEVHQRFDEMHQKLPEWRELRAQLRVSASSEFVRKELTEVETDIEDTESFRKYNYYIMESSPILDAYKKIISKPVKMSFSSKKASKDSKEPNETEKQRLIEEYMCVLKSYFPDIAMRHPVPSAMPCKKTEQACTMCSSEKPFVYNVEDGTRVCSNCFAQEYVNKTCAVSSAERVDNGKYEYDRIMHFRETIMQYSGKQNCYIDPVVFSDLEREFRNHYLLVGDESTPRETRFSKITKTQIMIFLKELGYAKHYENTNLIHYRLTGVKPDDITYLENKLVADFEKLVSLYDVMFSDIPRKNFIHTQCVLFLLLKRHKHKCNKENFSILKTYDRKVMHEYICSQLFMAMGWNFESSF